MKAWVGSGKTTETMQAGGGALEGGQGAGMGSTNSRSDKRSDNSPLVSYLLQGICCIKFTICSRTRRQRDERRSQTKHTSDLQTSEAQYIHRWSPRPSSCVYPEAKVCFSRARLLRICFLSKHALFKKSCSPLSALPATTYHHPPPLPIANPARRPTSRCPLLTCPPSPRLTDGRTADGRLVGRTDGPTDDRRSDGSMKLLRAQNCVLLFDYA